MRAIGRGVAADYSYRGQHGAVDRQTGRHAVVVEDGHSWCAGSAKGTGCGSCRMFEPDMCVDCNWAIISDEHLAVRKEIACQQETVIAM